MSPKNSHGFQNVSIFLQNLFKSFRIPGTRLSATDHTCTTSRQLTHYNLGMSQPIKAENLALKTPIWTHPKMPLFGPIFPFFGDIVSKMSPNMRNHNIFSLFQISLKTAWNLGKNLLANMVSTTFFRHPIVCLRS